MADPQGLCFWPGVEQVLAATFTFGRGIRPSVCVLEIVPQEDGIALDGTLSFTYDGTEIDFFDCHVDRASFRYDENGLIWSLSVMDRRVWWQYAPVPATGLWNERFETVQAGAGVPAQIGSIDVTSLKSPQQLATLLLLMMGETGFDVSQLPDESRPEALWDWDNPAQLLERLAESLGCRVVLGLDDNVRLVRLGVGQVLPEDGLLRVSEVLDPPEAPEHLTVVGGRTRYQVDFLLEAVGLDVDGTIQPINSLSYMPRGGWKNILPDSQIGFMEVAGWEPDPLLPPNLQQALTLGFVNPRQLARQTVYRWYRIYVQQDVSDPKPGQGPIIPGWGGGLPAAQGKPGQPAPAGGDARQPPPFGPLPGSRIQNLWQILPVEDVQVQGYYDPDGTFKSFPAWVFGVFYDDTIVTAAGNALTAMNSSPGSFCHKDFAVDRQRGLVMFSEPVFLINADGSFSPADLGLRCAVSVRDKVSAAVDRYVKVYPVVGGTPGVGARVIRRDELVMHVVPTYDKKTHKVTALTSTQAQNDAEAGYVAQAVALEYQVQTPQDATYAGIQPFDLDGAIEQVTWQTGAHGCTTRVGRQTEWDPAVPGYRELKLLQQAVVQGPQVQELQDQARRGAR